MLLSSLRGTVIALMSGLLGATMLASSAFAWDDWVQGTPDQLGSGATGYFIWHNDNGWNVRTHNDPSGVLYSGRIHTNGIFRDVSLVRAESTEHISVGNGGHTLHFRFKTYDHFDGLNFRIEGGSTLRFDLETNSHQTQLRQVFIGDTGRHPSSNPFSLVR
ncbi:MAG: hypothetical protein ACKVVP_01850 [Chloroflexota bacterium]